MNTNISVRNNQSFFKDPLNIAYWLGGSMPATFVPEHISTKIFTKSRMLMTRELFRHMNMFDAAFPSHTTLAKAAGLKRQAALKFFKWAEEIGLLKVIHRGKSWETNIYFLGDILKNPAVRWALRHVFKGLHRAFMKTVKVLNEAANVAKRTLLYKINVFKKNTSQGDYKDIKLHTSPYLNNNYLYQNMKKALWSDWSLKEDDYRRDIELIDLKLMYGVDKQEDVYKNPKYRQFKRNDAKYPGMYKKIKEYHDNNSTVKTQHEIVKESKISPDLMQERLQMCAKEENLNRRMLMFQKLKGQVDRASVPYIDFMIRKTRSKMEM